MRRQPQRWQPSWEFEPPIVSLGFRVQSRQGGSEAARGQRTFGDATGIRTSNAGARRHRLILRLWATVAIFTPIENGLLALPNTCVRHSCCWRTWVKPPCCTSRQHWPSTDRADICKADSQIMNDTEVDFRVLPKYTPLGSTVLPWSSTAFGLRHL